MTICTDIVKIRKISFCSRDKIAQKQSTDQDKIIKQQKNITRKDISVFMTIS